MRMVIRNGQPVSSWLDLWHPAGRLIDLTREIGTQKLGIAMNARICDVFVNNWRIRVCRGRQLQRLLQEIHHFQLLLTVNVPDGILWKNGPDDYGGKIISSGTWKQIMQRKDKVHWSKIIWFSQGVPRYAFITWLAFRNGLSTGRHTHRWSQPQECLFCGEPDETRDHLFFACPYTFMLWLQVVRNIFGVEPDPDWDITISRLITGTYDHITFILLRLVLQVTIYFIWRKRNDRRHNNSAKHVDQFGCIIEKTMRNRIMLTKYYLKPKLQSLICRWFGAHAPLF